MPDLRDRCEEHFCTNNNESIHLDGTVSSHGVNSQDLIVRYLSIIMLLDSNSQLWDIELIFHFFVNHFRDTSCFYIYFFEFLGLKYNVFISQ